MPTTRIGYLLALLGIAIVTSLFAADRRRLDSIEGCVRDGDSNIIDIKFFESAAKKNRLVASTETGESRAAQLKAAGEYERYAIEKRLTLPMPDGATVLLRYRGNSARMRREGCRDAYPPLLPFIE